MRRSLDHWQSDLKDCAIPILVVGFVFRPHESFSPLDPARRDVSMHHASASCGAQVATMWTMWRSFTLIEALGINFEIVVYYECMHVDVDLHLANLGVTEGNMAKKAKKAKKKKSAKKKKK